MCIYLLYWTIYVFGNFGHSSFSSLTLQHLTGFFDFEGHVVFIFVLEFIFWFCRISVNLGHHFVYHIAHHLSIILRDRPIFLGVRINQARDIVNETRGALPIYAIRGCADYMGGSFTAKSVEMGICSNLYLRVLA